MTEHEGGERARSSPHQEPAVALPDVPGLVVRPGHDMSDYATISDVINAAHAADGVTEATTAEILAMRWGGREHFDLARDVLVAELDGEAVAFGVGCRMLRDGVLCLETWGDVRPEWRHRGIGSALHRAARARLAAEASADPRPGPREFRMFARPGEQAATALAEQEGFIPIRFGFEMRRPLTGRLPAHGLPPGLELRPVRDGDHRAIFEADDEAFRDHWGHRPVTEADFRAMFSHPDVDTGLWCVAWAGDEVAGVVVNTIYREENARFGVRRGWLDRVSVPRSWRGRGVAKALCSSSLVALRDAGMDEAWLGVDAHNPTGALGLYEGLGFQVAHRWYAYGRPLDGPAGADWRSHADAASGP